MVRTFSHSSSFSVLEPTNEDVDCSSFSGVRVFKVLNQKNSEIEEKDALQFIRTTLMQVENSKEGLIRIYLELSRESSDPWFFLPVIDRPLISLWFLSVHGISPSSDALPMVVHAN